MKRRRSLRFLSFLTALLMLATGALAGAKAQPSADSRVMVYDAPDGCDVRDDYAVEVSTGGEWLPVPVYAALVTRCRQPCTETFFASVDLDGAMQVRVTPKNGFASAEIRPFSDGITGTVSQGALCFEVDKPCQLSVEFDGDVMHNLQLFVNEIPNETPDPNDPDVIFFEPGLHTAENDSRISMRDGIPILYVHSGQTVWLAGGAVVKTRLLPDRGARNVTIAGRGMLDLIDWNTPEATDESIAAAFGRRIFGVEAIDIAGLTVSGIVIRNATAYSICGQNLTDAKFENLKLFSCSDCSDGIDLMSSCGVEISNCYFRCNDDDIAISGTCWFAAGSSRDWNVKNCVFMADCAHAIYIGGIGQNDELCDMRFSDIDILDNFEDSPYFWGAIGINSCDGNDVHDLTFEDIRMERLAKSEPIRLTVRDNYITHDTIGRGISNVVFRRVTVLSTREKISLDGLADAKIKNVRFEDLTVKGRHIGWLNYRKAFHVMENSEGVRFGGDYGGVFGPILNALEALVNRAMDWFGK